MKKRNEITKHMITLMISHAEQLREEQGFQLMKSLFDANKDKLTLKNGNVVKHSFYAALKYKKFDSKGDPLNGRRMYESEKTDVLFKFLGIDV